MWWEWAPCGMPGGSCALGESQHTSEPPAAPVRGGGPTAHCVGNSVRMLQVDQPTTLLLFGPPLRPRVFRVISWWAGLLAPPASPVTCTFIVCWSRCRQTQGLGPVSLSIGPLSCLETIEAPTGPFPSFVCKRKNPDLSVRSAWS